MKIKMPNGRCFTCGAPCFGYKCKECAKKGHWGSLTRRAINRRHSHRRYIHKKENDDVN